MAKNFFKKRKFVSMLHVCLFFALLLLTSNAFASQPTKKFLEAVVYAGSSTEHSERYGAVSDFIKCLKDKGNTVSWEQAGKSWILHTTKKDALTKQTTKIAWEFGYDKKSPDIVALGRILVGKEVLNDSLAVMDNFKGCWEQPTWDTKKNILKSIQNAKSIYSESGISGIRSEVQTCYENSDKNMPKSNIKMMLLERCLGLDASGHVIDLNAQTTMSLPADPFFEKSVLMERASPFMEYFSQEDFSGMLDGIIEFAGQNL